MSTVSILGLGIMGTGMARRLLGAGHEVTVWNRSPEKARALAGEGAQVAATPREAAQASEFAICCVADEEAARAVWLTEETGAVYGLMAGTTAIESSTVRPAWIEELAMAVDPTEAVFCEAPLMGSKPQVEAGQLTVFIGGDEFVVESVKPIMKAYAAKVLGVGPIGTAARLKLAGNAMLGIELAGLAEILGMLERQGVDLPTAFGLLSASPVASPVIQMIGQRMLAEEFAPNFPLRLTEKDFRYILDTGGAEQMPVAQAVQQALAKAIEAGLGDEDISAVFRLYHGS